MVGSNRSEYAPAGGMNLNTTASQTTRGWSLRRASPSRARSRLLTIAACASGRPARAARVLARMRVTQTRHAERRRPTDYDYDLLPYCTLHYITVYCKY